MQSCVYKRPHKLQRIACQLAQLEEMVLISVSKPCDGVEGGAGCHDDVNERDRDQKRRCRGIHSEDGAW
eukprot:6186191-Pleurochrysis_carterae.AAC.2